MLVLKDNPIGVDKIIDYIQKDLNRVNWDDSYTVFNHRAYRTKQNKENIVEVFENGHYKEVLFDDRLNSTSFFLVDKDYNTTDGGNSYFGTKIVLIVQCNLSNLYPNIQHRADEEAKKDIIQVINDSNRGYKVTKVVTGDQVYSEFSIPDKYLFNYGEKCIFGIEIETYFNYNC